MGRKPEGAIKTAEEAGAQFIDVDIAPFQEACQPVIDNVTMKSEGAKALYEEIPQPCQLTGISRKRVMTHGISKENPGQDYRMGMWYYWLS